MLITVSGAQGQGKSTVLSALSERGHLIVPNKTARSILADWGKTLEEVYSDKPLTVDFHEAILERHAAMCKPYKDSSEVAFIERSYADIFSYALAVLGPFNTYSAWLNDFYARCAKQQGDFAAVIYLAGREYVPEADGVRSTNIHFSELVDASIKKYLKQFSDRTLSHRVFEVSSDDTGVRVEKIESIVNVFFGDNK